MARRILIADDDPNALRLVGYTLQAEGYDVVTATDGRGALAQLDMALPDLVILDVMMPGMSGLEVCERIRSNRATRHLPILMLSARGRVSDRVEGLRGGADDYLPKPADTGELVARVEALLTRASLPALPQRRVLAFLGAKGGVGTTTIATSLAILMADQGRSVCLAELQPGPSVAAHFLGLRPVAGLASLLAMPAGRIAPRTIQGCLTPHSAGLRLLAAPEPGEVPCDITPEFVDALVPRLAEEADYTLLDLPAGCTPANRAALEHARFTAVVTTATPLGVQCARSHIEALRRWGITGDLVGLVVANHGVDGVPMTLPEVRAEVQAGMLGIIPPLRSTGVPLSLPAGSPATIALQELLGRLSAERIRPIPEERILARR